MIEEAIDQDFIDQAYDLYFDDHYNELEDLLRPVKDSSNPHIEYLLSYCIFEEDGVEKDGEEFDGGYDEEYDRKRVKFLQECAEQDVADAAYHLAIHYWNGDGVEEDESKAAQLFEKGASLGHGMCTVTHGLNLYYGLFGLKVSKNKGLKYIKKAVDMKVPGAKEELEKIENEQKEHK